VSWFGIDMSWFLRASEVLFVLLVTYGVYCFGWRRGLERASWIVLTRNHSVGRVRINLAVEVRRGELPVWVDNPSGGQWTEWDRDAVTVYGRQDTA